MSQQVPAPNPQDEHTDLMAMLAAARELGPEMDGSLVDSYMRRREAERNRRQAPGQPGQPGGPTALANPRMLFYIGLGALGVALLLGTIASIFWAPATGAAASGHGGFPFWLPWLFFPWLFFVVFGRRGYYRSHRRYRYETQDGRRVSVYERRRGYGPEYPDAPGAGYDPRDPYAPPPPASRPDAPRSGYGTEYGADYRTDYRTDFRRDVPRDARPE